MSNTTSPRYMEFFTSSLLCGKNERLLASSTPRMPVYRFTTMQPGKNGAQTTTTIEKRPETTKSSDAFEDMAEVDWKTKSAVVRFDGTEVNVDSLLKRTKKIFSQSRKFLCGKKKYTWSESTEGNLELHEDGMSDPVAICSDGSTDQDLRLRVDCGLHAVGLDMIVLTALLMHHRRIERRLRKQRGSKAQNELSRTDDSDG